MLKEDNAAIRSSKQDPMQGIRMREQYPLPNLPASEQDLPPCGDPLWGPWLPLRQAGVLVKDRKRGRHSEHTDRDHHLVVRPNAFPFPSAAMIALSSCLSSCVNANLLITTSARFIHRPTVA